MLLTDATLLLTGGSGYLGRVLAATLLSTTPARLLLPLRAHHRPHEVAQAIAAELPDLTLDTVEQRCRFVRLPDHDAMVELLPVCREERIRTILHTAGSVAYFDQEALAAGNEGLTAALLTLGRHLEVEAFVYVSTAFSSGYRTGQVPETLHAAPDADPTDYTASKRACEHLVATSGLPWLIARPSAVIGDSRTGRYSGRPYGIYQLWRGFERLLSDRWQDTAHAVASDSLLQIVHQDAVAMGLIAALAHFEAGGVLHLVSDPSTLPTVGDAWKLWFDHLVQPDHAHFHRSVQEADRRSMSSRQRLFFDFTATNLEISERDWAFETTGMQRLAAKGHALPTATLESLATCQHAFVQQSPKLSTYLANVPSPVARMEVRIP